MEFDHSETSKFYSVVMLGVEVKVSSVYHSFFHLFIIIIIIIIIIIDGNKIFKISENFLS